MPQGSVISSFFYNIFTSDMLSLSTTLCITFADVTVSFIHHLFYIMWINIQHHLKSSSTWLNKCKIKVNPPKSVKVTVSLRRDTCHPVFIDNEPVPQSSSVRYLGVILDRTLTWSKHMSKVVSMSQRTKYLYRPLAATLLYLCPKNWLFKSTTLNQYGHMVASFTGRAVNITLHVFVAQNSPFNYLCSLWNKILRNKILNTVSETPYLRCLTKFYEKTSMENYANIKTSLFTDYPVHISLDRRRHPYILVNR